MPGSRTIANAVALGAAVLALMPTCGWLAAAQAAPLTVVAVDLDIAPGQIDAYLAAAKANAAEAVKEPGCHEFDIAVLDKDRNHVLLFEVYDNAAALEAHRATDHFKIYMATTKDMVAKRGLRPLSSVSMNMKGHRRGAELNVRFPESPLCVSANAGEPRLECRYHREDVIMVTSARKAPAQSGPLEVKVAEVDVAPGRIDAYLSALKENAAASVHEPGCREFDVMVSQNDPNHVFIFEVYDDAVAFEAHRESDHFKTFVATTKGMAAKVELRAFSSVAMNVKGK